MRFSAYFPTYLSRQMNLVIKVAVSAFSLSALSASAVVTLGETAAGFDLFVLSGPSSGDTAIQIKDSKGGLESNFNGILGIGVNADAEIESGVFFGGNSQIWKHTSSGSYSNGATLSPGTLQTLGVDETVNTAENQIRSFILALDNLVADPGLVTVVPSTSMTTSFTYATLTETTVLNFSSIDLDGEAINLTGGPNDQIVIKISGDSLLEGGSAVNLNGGLDRRNVIWLVEDGGQFDLHRNETANFEGIIINPTEGSGKNVGTIIGDVDFKGQVFAASMKLGTGMNFEGASVPEPSINFLLLGAFGGLMFRRRR